MAGLESNTVMLGWPRNKELMGEFLRVMRRLEHLKKSFIIGHIDPGRLNLEENRRPIIQVWWRGMQSNGDLMLLLAYLLKRNPEWRRAHVRVMSIAPNDQVKRVIEDNLKRIISGIRIDATPRVIVKPEDKTAIEMIHMESAEADVVFFGLASPEEGEEMKYAERLDELASDLPAVFFVKNSSMFIGELLKLESED